MDARPPLPHAGTTAAMVAKYRPAVPVMTLVVPYLKVRGWGPPRLHGSRSPPLLCCFSGGLHPRCPCAHVRVSRRLPRHPKTALFVAPPPPPPPPACLQRDGLKWKLEGRSTARQALLTSGLLPMLAAPTPSGARAQRLGRAPRCRLRRRRGWLSHSSASPLPALLKPLSLVPNRTLLDNAGESLIEEAVQLALGKGWVEPNDHVVVVSRSAMDEFMVKVRRQEALHPACLPTVVL